MSTTKLDGIIYTAVTFDIDCDGGECPRVEAETKEQIKALMLQTYNDALQLWIDKGAANVDEAFQQVVEAL